LLIEQLTLSNKPAVLSFTRNCTRLENGYICTENPSVPEYSPPISPVRERKAGGGIEPEPFIIGGSPDGRTSKIGGGKFGP
jgi:hypothetical protein